jgi:hypothetical protein
MRRKKDGGTGVTGAEQTFEDSILLRPDRTHRALAMNKSYQVCKGKRKKLR